MAEQCQNPKCGNYKTSRRRESYIPGTKISLAVIGIPLMFVTIGILALLYNFVIVPFHLDSAINSNSVGFVVMLFLLLTAIPAGLMALLSRIMKKNLFKGDLVFLYHCNTCGYDWSKERKTWFGDY